MQYADALDTEDLRHFDVGEIVVGGFYRRPKSLEGLRVRGINEEMWWDAVGALREAIRLKPELSLPKANLGIAYLLRPAGKDPGKAAELLEEAAQLASKDPSLDPISRLTEEINLAVAYTSQGDTEKALAALSGVENSLKHDAPGSPHGSSSLVNALSYNRAILLARSPDANRQRLAIGELEGYMKRASPALAWWPLAYQRYASLCRQFGMAPQSDSALLSQNTLHFRPVVALDFRSAQIALGENMSSAKEKLGAAKTSSAVIGGTNLVKLDYPNYGIQLLGTEELLGIVLSGDGAPPLPIKQMGLGAKSAQLKVGMTSADLDRVLSDSDYDFRQLVDPDLNYRFYPDLGIAVLTQGGIVTELVISQIPKELSLR
jgi:hypothetical protein